MIVHEETPQIAREDQPAPTCCHYWIIETANGPISRGECEICHEVRDFKNSVYDLERDAQDSRSRKGSEGEENAPQAATPQVPHELSQQLAVDELDNEESGKEESDNAEPDTEGTEMVEPEVEETEFAGVSED